MKFFITLFITVALTCTVQAEVKKSILITTIPNVALSNFNKERIRKTVSATIEENGSFLPVFEETLKKASFINYQKEIQKNFEKKIKEAVEKAKENYHNILFDASMEELARAKKLLDEGIYYLTDNTLVLDIYLYETLNQIALNSQGIQIYFKDLLKINKDLFLTLDFVSPKVIEEFETYKRKILSIDSLLKVHIKVTPAKGSLIYINTTPTKLKTDGKVALLPGDHYIRIKKEGYIGYAQKLTLDEEKIVEITLPKITNANFIAYPPDFPINDFIDYFKALEKENKTIIHEVLLLNVEYTNKRYQLVTKVIKLDESKILDTKISEIGIDLKTPNEHIKNHVLSLYPLPVKEELPKVEIPLSDTTSPATTDPAATPTH